jgi:NitT/TauT family transport system ATP-binding protein
LSAGNDLVLTINGVSRIYTGGIVALRDVRLRIEHGDVIVLLGPSGCGKSTLLRLIAGLDAPSSGTLDWDGSAPRPGDIGFVFQDPTLMPWANAADNASLNLRLRGQDPAPAHAMLVRMGLAGFEQARPSQLSGGMRMRVSIARALAGQPRLLLMDEPFAALDEFTRHRLQGELLDLTAAPGRTTVFVTHSIYEAAILATRVVIMSPRPGRIASVHELGGPEPDRLSPRYAERVERLTKAVMEVLGP